MARPDSLGSVTPITTFCRSMKSQLIVAIAALGGGAAFQLQLQPTSPLLPQHERGQTSLCMSAAPIGKKEGYVPKWKKKSTLAEEAANLSSQEKGLAGAVPITFQQGKGDDAKLVETSAMPGQPLKLVASQAGQFINYGCGKGECGTCESLCNGKYLRPCVDTVPSDLPLDPATGKYEPMVIQVKATRAKVVSSGKFFSFKSFILGFWNNLLGMFGFVRDRRKARKNWQERIEKENAVKRLAEEKRMKRLASGGASA